MDLFQEKDGRDNVNNVDWEREAAKPGDKVDISLVSRLQNRVKELEREKQKLAKELDRREYPGGEPGSDDPEREIYDTIKVWLSDFSLYSLQQNGDGFFYNVCNVLKSGCNLFITISSKRWKWKILESRQNFKIYESLLLKALILMVLAREAGQPRNS